MNYEYKSHSYPTVGDIQSDEEYFYQLSIPRYIVVIFAVHIIIMTIMIYFGLIKSTTYMVSYNLANTGGIIDSILSPVSLLFINLLSTVILLTTIGYLKNDILNTSYAAAVLDMVLSVVLLIIMSTSQSSLIIQILYLILFTLKMIYITMMLWKSKYRRLSMLSGGMGLLFIVLISIAIRNFGSE